MLDYYTSFATSTDKNSWSEWDARVQVQKLRFRRCSNSLIEDDVDEQTESHMRLPSSYQQTKATTSKHVSKLVHHPASYSSPRRLKHKYSSSCPSSPCRLSSSSSSAATPSITASSLRTRLLTMNRRSAASRFAVQISLEKIAMASY